MAKKRKTSKKQEKSEVSYSVEIIGIILILIGIIGLGFGPVGLFIKKFAMFLMGEWWILVLGLLIYMGGYMLIMRKLPTFFSTRLMGLYILLIVIFVAAHFGYVRNYGADQIIDSTINTYQERIGTIKDGASIMSSGNKELNIGGGIIGAGCATLLDKMFGTTGTIIVLVTLAIVALVMLFEVNLADVFSNIRESIERKREERLAAQEDDDDEEVVEDYDDEKDAPLSLKDLAKTATLPLLGKKNKTEEVSPVTVSTEIQEEVKLENTTQLSFASPMGIYTLPSINLLDEVPRNQRINNDFTKSNKIILERVLADFQIKGTVVEIHVGPAVTQYEVAIPSGTKVSRILSINKEIALALAAKDVRIEAPIPGKSTVGIEIPNPGVTAVKIREVLGNVPKEQEKAKILVSLGKDLMGRVQTADIAKMPHLLVAGSTGSGKSVCINSFIATMLMKYRPDEVKLVLVDPKKVELSNYNGVPHLLWPVVTDPKKANTALQRVVAMMEDRYETFSETGVKNIGSYNEWIDKQKEKDPTFNQEKMYYLVVIIDELADLMLVASKEVEDSIMRITQMARAAGIHLIVATQRPSTDVITGVVKANIPSRISFAVASQIDSRTILDMAGAEKLLGKGDMLYLPMGENSPRRIQGCFITDDEIARVIEYVCGQQRAQYDDSLNRAIEEEHNPVSGDKESFDDPLYNEIYEFAVETGKISASLIQRRFRLGYNRAARIIDLLEERGIIGPQNGSKPREVLLGRDGGGEEE
ncbi:MAG: DNA translocase FtsK 4TM domain-containing protein [Bacilli bacterium]|nr:DNA translocase FtsK 4TM domain-containing protein [Bacilli bacterium]